MGYDEMMIVSKFRHDPERGLMIYQGTYDKATGEEIGKSRWYRVSRFINLEENIARCLTEHYNEWWNKTYVG